MKRFVCAFLCLVLGMVFTSPLQAGGVLQGLDLTGFEPSPEVEGQFIARVVPRRWDSTCATIPIVVDGALDPIPNPLGEDFLPLDEVIDALQGAADQWNDIPTSYINMQIQGTANNSFAGGFDTTNEITFRYNPFLPPLPRVSLSLDFGAMAFVDSTVLLADFDLPDGFDLDGDGDPDVSGTAETCGDIDGDGDMEIPAKFYPAGSIIEVDFFFSSGTNTVPDGPDGFRFTVDPDDIDDNPLSVDLSVVALRAFGVAHGVAHNTISQRSRRDGTGSPMYATIDTGDAASAEASAAVVSSFLKSF